MKAQKFLLLLAAMLLAGSGSVLAGGRVYGSVGIYSGPYWGPVYPRPYYYDYAPTPWPYHYFPAPSVVVVPPPVYIEQNPPAPSAAAYWYYCASRQAYYPYVKDCPENWQKVLPQPEK